MTTKFICQTTENPFLSGILGLATADALGVPFEFHTRREMKNNPCIDMVGMGTYSQPAGTWSDDTSMALCVMDSLTKGYFDPEDIMKKFVSWMKHAKYTATDELFDIGSTTRRALMNFVMSKDIESAGNRTENGNGNGSLMRTLPISLWRSLTCAEDDPEFLTPVHTTSALTHAHVRSLVCCGIYTYIAREILLKRDGEPLNDLIGRGFAKAMDKYKALGGEFAKEIAPGNAEYVSPENLIHYTEDKITSGGYVLDTLHAALWCLLTTNTYQDCVLKSVNLGSDTDTTAAVAGGLAGLYYGPDAIPANWLKTLKKRELLEKIAKKAYDAGK
ncbi:MAG: ADP-ribosylglycohydrolase family protein [Clostridia bacterium]|nr:ADP-ribosylglycohydrolase family protein [Clostridia bacterium]